MERPGELVGLLLHARVLGLAAAFALLPAQDDLLQLLLLTLLLQRPQGPQHKRRLALDGRPDGGQPHETEASVYNVLLSHNIFQKHSNT